MMNKIFSFYTLILIILVFSSISLAQKTNKEMLVSTDWLAKNLSKVVVLHVASKKETYDAGHIPNARFLAYSEITTTRNGTPNELASVEHLQKVFTKIGVGNTKKIVLYGDLSGLQAARTFFTLDYLGQGNRIAILDGGLEKWKAEKREVSTNNVEPISEIFTPKINAKSVISIDTVRDVSWSVVNQNPSNFVLIDARPKEEYTGEKSGDGVIRAGHIPGAYSVFWLQNNLVSRENPVLKTEKELRQTYQNIGVTADKTIVVYCRTGGQASHTYFTLRYLGYNVMMYDGSYFDWNKQPDTPIITGDKRF
ncbi:MAG: sulfurtransferase [Pyrinomonadaceae bacterium]|nr:sulfurtransferase [Pyrinomonadaceae bacterium]